ncbi:MAG: argininosuccinate lyase [Ardenticatenaceae bacterium]|nr:argininosuccinate lyase [Anaerolineales bacterium]MCB8941926.1 argininosuccinate lyase [Ardenticatenaceae bacterium]MCB8973040.1 argininosuccinate lyase [Ardenticatenaceae bacterium]
MSKLWGGRFAKGTDALVHEFNASLRFDVRLAEQDIAGSQAWAQGLVGAGVLTQEEANIIRDGLDKVGEELANGRFQFDPADEDIHTAVERRLTEMVGAVGGKLHTGRSRNDQVATDFRLWLMGACDEVRDMLTDLQRALIASAEANLNLPMPGYTHLQHAQPVTWGHWILSHFWPLVRDQERLAQMRQRTAVLPLGSGALAGTAFPVDRHALADALGFAAISQNSLDGVSDRDFAADFLYTATMIGLHLSRLSEQLILFSSSEFGFVRLDDGYSTGSSLMPQKKNPDTLELTRGKSGRILGNLVGLLTTLKGLPSSYDKDLQEDKEPIFDAFDTLSHTLPIMAGLLRTLTLRPEHMAQQLEPNLLATDLADYLVKQGVPFRQAHHLVGEVVQLAENRGVALTNLSLHDLQSVSEKFGEGVTAVFNITSSLNGRNATGGTSAEALQKQLEAAKSVVVV